MSRMAKFCAGIIIMALLTIGLCACQTGISNTEEREREMDIEELLKTKQELRFREDGTFKILVISDVHGNGAQLESATKEQIEILVDREDPDLVLFDGDNTWQIQDETTLKACITEMVGYVESKHIPWAHVYGNHDAEGDNVPKERQQEIYESFAYCVSKAGDPKLSGIGNYLLPIYRSDSDKIAFNIWALDSGNALTEQEKKDLFPVKTLYEGHANSSYGYLQSDQIAWYYNTSKLLEEENGYKIPGLMAFHIPLQETYTAWENRAGLTYTGEKREDVCASPVNSGMFAAVCSRGDVKAIVNGHDHINDYMVEYHGVKLCYASAVQNTAYCHEDMLGGRVFVIHQDDAENVETYISYIHQRPDQIDVSNAQPLESGTKVDFEGDVPEFVISGFENNISDEAKVNEIQVEVVDLAGLDGSKALAVTRARWNNSNTGNNSEVKWALEKAGTLGTNKYIRVWMDLSTNQVDFRKASWGLIENNTLYLPYSTDERNDAPSPFYYLAEGATQWVEMKHGNDGCFGAGDGQSVKGLKGWFAFPIKNMPQRTTGNKLTEDSVITGIYFYFSFASVEMAGKQVYIDDVTLVNDYTAFD